MTLPSSTPVPSASPEPARRAWLRHAGRAGLSSLGLAAALSLGGCVVAPYGHGGYGNYPGPAVGAEPPPPQAEYQPAAPGPAYVWIGGYWAWQLGRHVWIGGRWALPPAGYNAWVPGQWQRGHGGWHWNGGRWGRRH